MSAHQKKYLLDFKTQYGLGFDPQDDEIVVEFFCGGGAAGAGLNYGSGAIRMRPANYLLAAINLCKFYVDDTQETLAV
jgi:DNA (cytosine-5)-methyltransferase 1